MKIDKKDKIKKGEKKQTVLNSINEFLELPRELTSDIPKITMLGYNQMLIENHKGIIEYEDYIIRINTSVGTVIIEGLNLALEHIESDDLSITGNINNIEFVEM